MALGDLALAGGKRLLALQYYSAAAGSQSEVGQAASASMAQLELEQNPGKYLKTRLGMDNRGRVAVAVYNSSPVPVTSVEVSLAYFDQAGRQVSDVQRYRLRGTLAPGTQGTVSTRLTEGRGLRSTVSKARIVQ